jgi:DNA-binding transcriptional LysR family regulator
MTAPPALANNVELRLLRYVIAVAEELHFTRASMRLHLATPSLSRQIRQLEQLLGYALFWRKTREVTLTPAGIAFVAEARQAILHTQRAVEAGAAASASIADVVRIGHTPLLDAALLPQIRRSFSLAVNNVSLLFQSTYSVVQVDHILSGRLHAGLVVLPIVPSELRTESVFRYRLVAAVPADSDLATRGVLGPDNIAEQPIIWFGRSTNPHLYQHFVECCQQAGFTPNIAHEVSTVMEMLDAVSAGLGISFVKEAVRTRLHPDGIAFRELAAPDLSIEIGVVYRSEDSSPHLLALRQALTQLSNCGYCDVVSTVNACSD